ncbi:MAG: hypothetical protein FGM44_08620, partial [Limnohabitans sp.]|nr:hypothetical protein [Limnohabitans sp.]
MVLSSASDVLGPAGQIVKFNFNQSVSNFGIQQIQLSPANYTLSQLKRVDDLGTVWSALITPPPGVNGTVSVSVSSSVATSSTVWSWTVDTQAPTTPTVSLGVTAANVVSDSGKFANDGISNVKTPRVRVDLSADAAVGDGITLTQVDKTSQRPILDTSTGLARNQKVVALTLADITNRFILMDLQDLGADGAYQLKVVQQDAAGNAAPAAVIDYTLLTTPPGAPAVNLVAGQVDLGLDVTGLSGKTPPGLVNALAKNAGITFSGTGGAQGADIAVTWGTITKKLQADSKGSWTVRFASNEVPADSPATVLSVSQTDVAGNRSAVSAYTVEVATAGVSAKVLSMGVEDDSGAVSLGAYSVNAQGTVPSGQSTDDSTPVVTIRLDRNLQTNEVIELYDGPITANAKPVLTLSGTAVAVENGLFIWRATTSSWAQANTALKAGAHQLSARVINTHTWDVGTEVDAANRATLSVQSLNFNQLLLNDDPATNQIPANQSAGAVVLNGVAVNKPVLGGTLQTALASGERLAVYDTVSGVDKLLGTATLVAVKDSNNVPTGTYTWRFTPPTGLSNGLHSLSVRLETDSATPVVRLAMSQDITVTIPVLSIAPASASPNGLSTDTGISSTDGISSSKTPYLRLLFPSVGRQVGDIVTVVDVADNNKVVATQSLT